MSLDIYSATPFNVGTKVGRLDVFVGDGATLAFDSDKMDPLEVASVTQVENDTIRLGAGGFSKTGTGILFENAPAINAIVIVPNVDRLRMRAYNQDTIPGLTNPNIKEGIFYVADPIAIPTIQYEKSPGNSGILVRVTDNDDAFAASADWVEFGYADPATGDPTTYGSPAADLPLPDIKAVGTLNANASSGATLFSLDDVSEFLDAFSQTLCFLMLDASLGTQEILQISNVNSVDNEIEVFTPSTFAHSSGATVQLCGLGVRYRLTVPTSAAGPNNYHDLSVDLIYDELDRS